jgi:hypothetical protein
VSSHEELAAIAAAIALLWNQSDPVAAQVQPVSPSRWKIADRNAELEIEELRAVR